MRPIVSSSRIELETFRVLGECDYQLHHDDGMTQQEV